MPRPRVAVFWIEEVRQRRANNPRMSAPVIRKALLRLGQGKPPSERTIARIIEEFEGLEPGEKVPYKLLSWPSSFESGAMPWEAARASLDLLGYVNKERRNRPTVAMAMAFWHATASASDADVETRMHLALYLILDRGNELERYAADRLYLPNDGGTGPREEAPVLKSKGDPLPGKDLSVLGPYFRASDGAGIFEQRVTENEGGKENG